MKLTNCFSQRVKKVRNSNVSFTFHINVCSAQMTMTTNLNCYSPVSFD